MSDQGSAGVSGTPPEQSVAVSLVFVVRSQHSVVRASSSTFCRLGCGAEIFRLISHAANPRFAT